MNNKETSRNMKIFAKWTLTVFLIIICTIISTTNFSNDARTLLLIPLALSFSMFHPPLSSAIVGGVCGLIIDISSGKIVGLNGIFLLIFSVIVSLFCLHLLRTNLINAIIVTIITSVIIIMLDYFFNFVIWREEGYQILLGSYFVPTMIYTILSSPIIYLIVKIIVRKFDLEEAIEID